MTICTVKSVARVRTMSLDVDKVWTTDCAIRLPKKTIAKPSVIATFPDAIASNINPTGNAMYSRELACALVILAPSGVRSVPSGLKLLISPSPLKTALNRWQCNDHRLKERTAANALG